MAVTPWDCNERNKHTPIDDNRPQDWPPGGVGRQVASQVEVVTVTQLVLERYTLVKETIHNEAN